MKLLVFTITVQFKYPDELHVTPPLSVSINLFYRLKV